MKLISLHVANFGKMHDLDLDFKDGVNSFCERNGWGKSTLSAFIKVMFYGFDGERSQDEFVKERKRYMPWGGGSYGGSIIFEINGTVYKVTRIFKEKAALDEFELRYNDTNIVSYDYSSNLGEEIFKINSESFAKTVFIRQNDCSNIGTTGDINSKLGNITDSIDLNRYQAAQNLLKDKVNSLVPNRKTGEINRLKSRASELKGEIAKTGNIENSMDEVEGRINDINLQISEVNKELDGISAMQELAAKYEKEKTLKAQYTALQNEIKDKTEVCESKRILFAGKIPSAEVIKEWNEIKENAARTSGSIEQNSLSSEEKIRFDVLSNMFSETSIDETELDGVIETAQYLEDIQKEASKNDLSLGEQNRLAAYKEEFSGLDNPVEDVNAVILNADRRKNITSEEERLKFEFDNLRKLIANASTSKNHFLLPLAIVFIIISIGSFVAYFAVDSILLIAAGIVFAVVFAVSFFLFFKQRRDLNMLLDGYNNRLAKCGSELKKNNAEFAKANSEIASFLLNCGKNVSEDRYDSALRDTLIEASEYVSLLKKDEYVKSVYKLNDYDSNYNRVSDYLTSLGLDMNDKFLKTLWDIKNKHILYSELLRKKISCDEAKERLIGIENMLRRNMWDYGIEPGVNPFNKLDDVVIWVSDIYEFQREIHNLSKRLDDYIVDYPDVDFTKPVSADIVPLDELKERKAALNAKLEELNSHLSVDRRTLDDFREQFEKRQDMIEELEEVNIKIEQLTYTYNNLLKTQEYLTKAKENLTAKYMGPLMEGFGKYYKMLSGEVSDNYCIDANSELTIEKEGKQRNIKLLSSGYQDLIGLCMRLAMTDAMYPDEKPVIIMDDPFVNLDDDKLELSNRFLEAVSGYYQILYLTCSKTRL